MIDGGEDMRKEDIINKIQKVVYDVNEITFIIQTVGDNDFWSWTVNRLDIIDYFTKKAKSPAALYEIQSDKLSKVHCNEFINDLDNNMLGSSTCGFDNIDECIKDALKYTFNGKVR